jgi:hypothetical protein
MCSNTTYHLYCRLSECIGPEDLAMSSHRAMEFESNQCNSGKVQSWASSRAIQTQNARWQLAESGTDYPGMTATTCMRSHRNLKMSLPLAALLSTKSVGEGRYLREESY